MTERDIMWHSKTWHEIHDRLTDMSGVKSMFLSTSDTLSSRRLGGTLQYKMNIWMCAHIHYRHFALTCSRWWRCRPGAWTRCRRVCWPGCCTGWCPPPLHITLHYITLCTVHYNLIEFNYIMRQLTTGRITIKPRTFPVTLYCNIVMHGWTWAENRRGRKIAKINLQIMFAVCRHRIDR